VPENGVGTYSLEEQRQLAAIEELNAINYHYWQTVDNHPYHDPPRWDYNHHCDVHNQPVSEEVCMETPLVAPDCIDDADILDGCLSHYESDGHIVSESSCSTPTGSSVHTVLGSPWGEGASCTHVCSPRCGDIRESPMSASLVPSISHEASASSDSDMLSSLWRSLQYDLPHDSEIANKRGCKRKHAFHDFDNAFDQIALAQAGIEDSPQLHPSCVSGCGPSPSPRSIRSRFQSQDLTNEEQRFSFDHLGVNEFTCLDIHGDVGGDIEDPSFHLDDMISLGACTQMAHDDVTDCDGLERQHAHCNAVVVEALAGAFKADHTRLVIT
jgi:hypothetical protein